MRMGILAGVLTLLIPLSAVAQEKFDHSKQYSHKGQFGLHGQGGLGFRFIAPYDNEFCGQLTENEANGEAKKVCSEITPLTMDLGVTFGVTHRLELMFEVRMGLANDFGESFDMEGPKQFAFAPGLRFYIRDAGLMKFFSSFQFVVDTTKYEQAPGTDYGIRNTNGLQFDFHRTVGVYFYFGETMAFNRWFRFEFDGGAGLQFRVP